jgi:quinol monooxygenase YgiN
MITFIAHLQVKAENAAPFEALMTYVRDKTRENEPGVAYYDFSKSAKDPSVYLVVEVYRDAAAHAHHMDTDWVKESLPKSARLIDGKPDIKQYVSPGTEPVRRRYDPDAQAASST